MATTTSYNQPIVFKGVLQALPDGRGGQIGVLSELASRMASVKPYRDRGRRDETGDRSGLTRQYVVECWHDPVYTPNISHTIDWLGVRLTINEWSYTDSTKTKITLLTTEQV